MVERPHARWPEVAAQVIIVAGVLLIPLVVAPDLQDRFRIIKDSVARAESFLLLFLLVAAVALSGTERLREVLREKAVVGVLAAAVVWTAVAGFASTQRAWSMNALVTVSTSAILFFVVLYIAPSLRLYVLDALVPVTIVTTGVLTMQEYGIWQPFTSESSVPHHLRSTAFMDNPNVVGSYLTLTAVILAAAALHIRGFRRWLYVLGVLASGAGVLVSETRSAVLALAAGLLLIGAVRSWKTAVASLVAVVAVAAVAVSLHLDVVSRIADLRALATAGEWNQLTSGRVGAGLAAYEMFRADPLTGLGPGTYGFNYMTYRVAVDAAYPRTLTSGTRENFGDTHNDHLQLLAESGVAGYLIFAAALLVLAAVRYSGRSDDPRARFARAVAIPLAGTLVVLALAQFPLQVAVTRHLLVTFAAVVVGWRGA